eukprot:gene48261-59103_t
MHRYRSHTCAALRKSDVGQTVRLSGWVHRVRDHGGLLFIDLRDHYGITQVVADPDSPAFKLAETVRGRNGGVRLPKPASAITLFDVVKVTEDSFAMAECFEAGEIDCPLVDSCGLNSALRKALNAFFEVLQGYTIDDL